MKVDTYLSNSYKLEDIEKFRKRYYSALDNPEANVVIGAFFEEKLVGIVCLLRTKTQNKNMWGVGV